jgi:hypothetical protein
MRAQEHLVELSNEVLRFINDKPYTIRVETHFEIAKHVIYVDTVKEPSPRMQLAFGSALQSLRSCLDHMVWHMSPGVHSSPNEGERRSVNFPIYRSNDGKFSKGGSGTGDKALKYIPKKARTIIKDLQPFHRGNAYEDSPLWQLDKLNNIDKHRAVALMSTRGAARVLSDTWNMGAFKAQVVGFFDGQLGPGDRIKPDAEIGRMQIGFGDNPEQMAMNGLYEVDIALDEPPWEMSLVEFLPALLTYLDEEVFQPIAPHL